MAGGGLQKRRIEGIGEGSVTGAFAGLLSLTSDAVLVFDGLGRILLANDEVPSLFACPASGVIGSDVRLLFPPAVGVVPDAAFTLKSLPFGTDGSSTTLSCVGSAGQVVDVNIRCQKVRAPGETYLLVAHASFADDAARRDNERLVGELSRANRRLSGTLQIVLSTLDSEDVNTLFHRVLDEISSTMDAAGTLVYLAESDGFHLRGTSEAFRGGKMPRFMPFGRTIETLATREGKALRLRVLPPGRDALRQGRLTKREVVDEETHEVHTVRANVLPPFASFIAVPVWFGGHVIAILEVGWKEIHPMRREDAQLLDAVAEYLSVQLMGAFASLRSQRAEHLDAVCTDLRDRLMASNEVTPDRLRTVLTEASRELGASLVHVELDPAGGEMRAQLPIGGMTVLPFSLQALEEDVPEGETNVEGIVPDGDLAVWLRGRGEPCLGALVDVGELHDARSVWLMLRPADAEPMSDIERTFLERLADDIHEVAEGDEARTQDKHISQALQTGMKNELQRVDGITAQGLYSSATASAFVGGDFYDLIRLPNRCACVIMGDVSGKGVEAASVSAAVKTALGAYAWEGLRPARMVRSLNEFLLGFSRIETFATLFVGIVDLPSSTITYCSAGHPPAILRRAQTGELVSLDVQSGVVGAFHDMLYQDGEIGIGAGDVLMLYTDGTTEARDPRGAFFGEDGLRDALTRECACGFDGLTDRLLATLDDFTGNNLEDDVAMVALRFDEVG